MDVDTIIKKTMTDYDHVRPPGVLSLDASPIRTFLAAPKTTSQGQISMTGPTIGQRSVVLKKSRIEQIPHEALSLILKNVSISSLVAFAAANSNSRTFVRSMPEMVKILQAPLAADAIARMVEVGSARNFTLGDFMEAFQSFPCRLCQSSSPISDTVAFAADFCLLRCHRVCRQCVMQENQIFFLPLDMAKRCFSLGDTILSNLPETARAPVLEMCEWSADLKSRRLRYRWVKVVSVNMALQKAIAKHGDLSKEEQPIKVSIYQYLSSKGIRPAVSRPIVQLAEGLEVGGFAQAVEKAWEKKHLQFRHAKVSLVTLLPYLHPKKFPVEIERGFQCEGCVRDEWKSMTASGGRQRMRKAWLREQVVTHFNTCDTAKMIAAGYVQSMTNEIEWVFRMRSAVHYYWPNASSRPQLMHDLVTTQLGAYNRAASNLGGWNAKSLEKIMEAGKEFKKQQRLQAVGDEAADGWAGDGLLESDYPAWSIAIYLLFPVFCAVLSGSLWWSSLG
jgi:hypothetical protein